MSDHSVAICRAVLPGILSEIYIRLARLDYPESGTMQRSSFGHQTLYGLIIINLVLKFSKVLNSLIQKITQIPCSSEGGLSEIFFLLTGTLLEKSAKVNCKPFFEPFRETVNHPLQKNV
jgi:hypothetical protein